MNEYQVRIKDLRQNITHKANQLARNKQQANQRFLRYLRRAFKHRNFEVL